MSQYTSHLFFQNPSLFFYSLNFSQYYLHPETRAIIVFKIINIYTDHYGIHE